MAIIKNKTKSSKINITDEATDMFIDGIIPPAPDTYPAPLISNQGNQAALVPSNAQTVQIQTVLNEQALNELTKKEEENLIKKENSQKKNLEEIKTNLKSMNSFFKNKNIGLYQDNFYADLKMRISK